MGQPQPFFIIEFGGVLEVLDETMQVTLQLMQFCPNHKVVLASLLETSSTMLVALWKGLALN